MSATFYQGALSRVTMVDHTPSGADVASGQLVQVGDQVLIAHLDITDGVPGALAAGGGIYKVTKATGGGTAIAAGRLVYADITNQLASESALGPQLGITVAAAADADSEVIVLHVPLNTGAGGGILDKAQQALSGAGAITVTEFYTAWTTTGADAGTLADGLFVGQLKKIQLIVDGGDGTLTPANLAGGTTITFADAGDYAVLRWNGSDWRAIELGNDTDGATAPVLA